MTTADSRSVVASFFKAWTTGDFDTARSLLHDDVRGLSQIVQAAHQQKVFADDNDVCVIYDLVTATPAGTAPTAEWYRLRDGKISAVRVYFDARPFAPMFEHQGS